MTKLNFERKFLRLFSLVALFSSTAVFAFVQHSQYPITAATTARYPRSFTIQPTYVMNVLLPFKEQVLPSSALFSSASSSSSSIDDDADTSDADASTPSEEKEVSASKLTFRERWEKAFPKREGDELPFRQRLAKMGLACVLSYGFVANMNAGITTGLAWFAFAKRVS